MTQYVRDVVDGNWVDHGLQLNADTMGQGGWKRIVSLDDSNTSLLPHLDVTWHAPGYLPLAQNLFPIAGEAVGERDLHWEFDDGDGNPAVYSSTEDGYQVQVSTNSDFSAIVADSGMILSSSNSYWMIPDAVPFTDGASYYWRVKVRDGSVWSAWSLGTFVWNAAYDGTGIDSSDTPYLTPADLGYTQADADAVNSALLSYKTLDPTGDAASTDGCGPDPCGESYPPPSYDLLPNLFMWHEKHGKWCVPAVVGTILQYRTTNYDVAQGSRPSVYHYESYFYSRLTSLAGETKFGNNGIASYWGLKLVNQELGALPKYVRIRPSSATDLRIISKSETWTMDVPLYLEINARDTAWVWHVCIDDDQNGVKDGTTIHYSYPQTHATVVVGYNQSGTNLLVGDPYITDPSQVANGQPTFDGGKDSADESVVWVWPYTSVYLAMDVRPNNVPVWYAKTL